MARAYTSQQASEAEARKAAEQQGQEINRRLDVIEKSMAPADVETREFDDKSMPAEAVTQDVNNANKFYLNLHKLAQPPRDELLAKAGAFKKFLPILAAFAALGTVASRGNIAVGIKAMAGGLRGLAEGDRQKYEDAYNVWKSTTDDAIRDNQMRVQAMRDIIGDRSLNVSQQLQALSIYAHETPTLMKAIQNHDIKEAGDVVGALSRAADTAVKQHKEADDTLKPLPANESQSIATFATAYLLQLGQEQKLFAGGQAMPSANSTVSAYYQGAVAALTNAAGQYVKQGMSMQDAVRTAYGDLLKNNSFSWDAMKQDLANSSYNWPKGQE